MNRDEVTLCRSKVHDLIQDYHERTIGHTRSCFEPAKEVSSEQSYDEVSGYVERPNNDFNENEHGILVGFKKLVRLLGVDV